MAKTLTLLLTLFFGLRGFAQDGIYQTAEDLKNGKLLKVDSGTMEFYGKAYCKVGGVKKVFKVSEVYAAKEKGSLKRFWDGHVWEVYGAGKYYFWHFRNNGDHGAYYDGYALSLGVEGQLYNVRLLNGLKDLAAKHPEFELIYECTAGQMAAAPKNEVKGAGGGSIYGFVQRCLSPVK